MYKVIFSVNNNEEVWTLPHVPADLEIPSPAQSNETYTGLSRDYRRIGTMGLISMSWKGLLPVGRRYAFMPAEASEDGWAYKDFFDRWRDRKVPFRLIILDIRVEYAVQGFQPFIARHGAGGCAQHLKIIQYVGFDTGKPRLCRVQIVRFHGKCNVL